MSPIAGGRRRGGGTPARAPDESLRAGRAAIEAALPRALDELLAGVPAALAEPIRYAVQGGGKRMRPVLCLMAYEAAGGAEPGAAAELACALELVHTYSLIHDDLPCMDDDALRRGRPTTHRVFGTARAVVAGAALIPLAVAVVLRGACRLGLDDEGTRALVRELCRAAGGGGMVAGQWLDLQAERRSATLAELAAIHEAKTASLLAAAPRMGALAAGADAVTVGALGDYGRRLGLAFQIVDDVLDVTATAEVLGKTAGRDQALQKATYPALLGVPGARRKAAAEARGAVAALRRAGIQAPSLEALARYAVERDR
jgi:geranylgeranyl diphosphate synthase type II